MLFSRYEAKLSTKEAKARKNARFSRPPQDKDWSSHPQASPPERPRPPRPLMPGKNRVSRADFMKMRGFRRANGTFFTLSWGEMPGRRVPGAAVVVSKKVASRATLRNTIKRRARVALQKLLPQGDSSLVFVLIARKGAHAALFKDIRADIVNLMAHAVPSR